MFKPTTIKNLALAAGFVVALIGTLQLDEDFPAERAIAAVAQPGDVAATTWALRE